MNNVRKHTVPAKIDELLLSMYQHKTAKSVETDNRITVNQRSCLHQMLQATV